MVYFPIFISTVPCCVTQRGRQTPSRKKGQLSFQVKKEMDFNSQAVVLSLPGRKD